MNANYRYFDYGLIVFVRLLGLYPMHLVARPVRAAGTMPNRHCSTPERRASPWEALLQAPVGVGRFVIRATHERGVGVPSSRSLSTASREAESDYKVWNDSAEAMFNGVNPQLVRVASCQSPRRSRPPESYQAVG